VTVCFVRARASLVRTVISKLRGVVSDAPLLVNGNSVLTAVTAVATRHKCALHVPGRIAKTFASSYILILAVIVRCEVGADITAKTLVLISTVDCPILGDVLLLSGASLNHWTCAHASSVSGCSVAR
jgi:hypothetical protein